MDNKNVLEKIICSDNVKDTFYEECKNNEFSEWLIGLIPEIADCANCNQNNSWHIYNVLDHTLVATDEMNKLTLGLDDSKRKMFSYVMFFHDLGKPKYHLVAHFEDKDVDYFPDHQKGSKEIAERVLPQLNFDQKEINKICLLILNHDIFTKIVKNPTREDQKQLSPELIEKLISDFNKNGDGIEILNDIILIGIADNKAQNPEKTAEPLEVLAESKLIVSEFQKKNEKEL